MKKILIIGANSGIGKETALLAAESGYEIYATARAELAFKHQNITSFKLDVCDENSIRAVAAKIDEIEAIINFAGVAISSPVEFLNCEQLQKQLDINLFGLLKVIRGFYPKLASDGQGGRIINVSSMAAFGLFPFISPYCASKAAGDILLNSFGIETGTRVISIKPGVVKTPFWEASLRINEENFENFAPKYEKERTFLIENAKKNANQGLEPLAVAKVIIKALKAKNPKPSYTVGFDAHMAQLASMYPKALTNSLIRAGLKLRVGKK